MKIVRTVAALRGQAAEWRRQGESVALIPTMGALHEGHLSLVRRGLTLASRAVVSIFVNPTQFGPNEDLSRYPRQEAADAARLDEVGAHLLFAPSVAEMYPQGFATTVSVSGLVDVLCGPRRPGHFDGVATVVTKLLIQAAPDVALFGEKDYQQLAVIRRAAADLDLPVRIEGAPTIRESDGLAMSSRNAYLTPDQRAIAPQLYATLNRAAAEIAAGRRPDDVLAAGKEALLAGGFDAIDYLEIWEGRLFAAAFLGRTRLIDNIPVS